MTIATVDPIRWSKFNILEQMGNIGSEVGRAVNAKQNGRVDDCNRAVIRALDLFSLTVDLLVAQGSKRTKEVLRARDEFLSVIFGKFEAEKAASIDRYFLEFAIAARNKR